MKKETNKKKPQPILTMGEGFLLLKFGGLVPFGAAGGAFGGVGAGSVSAGKGLGEKKSKIGQNSNWETDALLLVRVPVPFPPPPKWDKTLCFNSFPPTATSSSSSSLAISQCSFGIELPILGI